MAKRARPNKKKKPKKAEGARQVRAQDPQQVIDRAKREYVRDIETLNRERAAEEFPISRRTEAALGAARAEAEQQIREVNDDTARQLEEVTEAHVRRRLKRPPPTED